MVLPPPTAPEGQAGEEWLKPLRRWLHLGREGVIILIRGAAPARLRELVELLVEIDEGLAFFDRAEQLTQLDAGALVLLSVRGADLDWLNLNRPLFAQKRLRAVLWTSEGAANALKFRAPDLHDWISHYVVCPEGTPRFTCRALEVARGWWPGIAWTGPFLRQSWAALGLEDAVEIDAGWAYPRLLETLERARERPVWWSGVQTWSSLWRVRWALAESRHRGQSVLIEASIHTPGWFPIDGRQHELALAVDKLTQAKSARPFIEAALLELERVTIDARLAPRSPEQTLDDVAVLRRPGLETRQLHASDEVGARRRQLLREIQQSASIDDWSIDELALFASLARDRATWPAWSGRRLRLFDIEHELRFPKHAQRQRMIDTAVNLRDEEVARHWESRWDLERSSPARLGSALRTLLDQILRTQRISPGDENFQQEAIIRGQRQLLQLGEQQWWNKDTMLPLLSFDLLRMYRVPASGGLGLRELEDHVLGATRALFGERDVGFIEYQRLFGLAWGLFGDWERARDLLEIPPDSTLSSVNLEWLGALRVLGTVPGYSGFALKRPTLHEVVTPWWDARGHEELVAAVSSFYEQKLEELAHPLS